MFDKLFNMIHKIEPESSTEKAATTKSVGTSVRSNKSGDHFMGKSVAISADPFNRKTDLGKSDRMQEKMELIKQLREELGIE